MALTLGTNVGFVTTAPTADPAGSDTTIDGSSVVVKHTTPAGAVKITEIGWYRGTGTNTANFEIALYADTSSVAAARLFVDATNSSSAGGWITVAVDWAVSASTAYWLGLQMDAHTGSSTVDSATSGGAGIDVRTSQTTLNDPYGGGAVSDADGMYAIYGLVQIAPTVALNSPADTATVGDTTPTLDFTGTDTNADSIEYNVQIDTVNTFDSQVGSPALLDSYNESNQSASASIRSGTSSRGQSFTGQNGILETAKFHIKKNNSPTGSAFAKIYAHSGTYGVDGVPTGSALATSDAFDVSTLISSDQLITFTFSGAERISLVGGTYYFLVIEYTGGDISNNVGVGVDTSSPTHSGNGTDGNGGSWFFNSAEVCFYIYTSPASPLLNKVSETDAGFVNPDTGGDTHPFNSGENIQFTVQGGDALSNDTYYWRVRGIDPTGSNTYGAWSSTRSFTVGGSAALTGTLVPTGTEAEIVAGGETLIITLTDDTWIAAGALSFDLQRDEIIAGVTSAQGETLGWNLVPKALQNVTGVVRTSDTVVTITWDAQATYDITAPETITVTIPSTAVVGGNAIVATPTFQIDQTVSERIRDMIGGGVIPFKR